MSTPPKAFAPVIPFGASPQTPATTQVQPLALNSGTQTPAMSGYSQTQATPATPDSSSMDMGSGGSAQEMMNQYRTNRGGGSRGGPMPFYG